MRSFVLTFSWVFIFALHAQDCPSVSKVPRVDSLYCEALHFAYLEDFQSSLIFFDQVIALDPEVEEVFFDRGIIKEHLGDKLGAIQDFSQAIKTQHHFADAYYLRGKLYLELNQYQLALNDLKRANRIDGMNAHAHCLCAEAAAYLKKTKLSQRKAEQCRLLNQ